MVDVYAPVVTGQIVSISHRPLAILDNPLGLPYVDGDYYAYPDALPSFSRDQPPSVTLVFRRPRQGEIDWKAIQMRPMKETEPASPDGKGGNR